MFRDFLSYDLQQIFDINRIIFDVVSLREQEALYVDISDVKQSPQQGQVYFRIRGVLATINDKNRIREGYMIDRLVQSTYKHKARFFFGSVEHSATFADYNDSFIKSYLPFSYRLLLDYNPALGKISKMEI